MHPLPGVKLAQQGIDLNRPYPMWGSAIDSLEAPLRQMAGKLADSERLQSRTTQGDHLFLLKMCLISCDTKNG